MTILGSDTPGVHLFGAFHVTVSWEGEGNQMWGGQRSLHSSFLSAPGTGSDELHASFPRSAAVFGISKHMFCFENEET